MCLSIPAKIIEINDKEAVADMNGSLITVHLDLLERVKIGDYVLVHTGFALEKISHTEATETLKFIRQLDEEK